MFFETDCLRAIGFIVPGFNAGFDARSFSNPIGSELANGAS